APAPVNDPNSPPSPTFSRLPTGERRSVPVFFTGRPRGSRGPTCRQERAAVNRISILPTLLTLGNAVCGFASIALASHVTLDGTNLKYDAYCLSIAGALILAAMIFDALDGYAARLTRSASEFGGQLDSLCDAISFGLAPAFLLLRLRLQWPSPLVQQA